MACYSGLYSHIVSGAALGPGRAWEASAGLSRGNPSFRVTSEVEGKEVFEHEIS